MEIQHRVGPRLFYHNKHTIDLLKSKNKCSFNIAFILVKRAVHLIPLLVEAAALHINGIPIPLDGS